MIATLAAHELRLVLRQRWVVAYALLFAILASAVSYFGLSIIELTGWQEFDRTAVSLLNLVLYIVPLACMLMTVHSLRTEGGATDQLFAEPVTRTEVLLGKVVGLSGVHLLATLIGFGVPGVLIGIRVGSFGLPAYLALVAFTAILGIIFIALASLTTIAARRSARAYAVILAAWFVFLLLFDLLIIGLTFVLPEQWATRLALCGLFLNPVDATRVGTLLAISGKELFGAAGAQLVRSMGGPHAAIALLVAVLAAWVAVPLAVCARWLRRQDL
jgi:Cu-processing system permease protein